MLARVLAANVVFGWFAADAGYGRAAGMRTFCYDHAVTYAMAVPLDLPLIDVRADVVLQGHPERSRPPVGAPPGWRGRQGPATLRLGDARGHGGNDQSTAATMAKRGRTASRTLLGRHGGR
ncbi:hypothetical protein [Kutzneria buriramensis]